MQVDVRSDVTLLDPDSPVAATQEPLARRSVHPPAARRGTAREPWLWPILVILGFLIAAHGWALGDGLFLDDHLHRVRYADDHWSWQSLLDASTVKPDEFMQTWWQEQTIEWHYTRPLAILLGKIVYHLSNGRPAALHAVSLVLHLASSIMVFALARMLTRRTGWALVAGLLFVVYSHSVYAVAWLAAQNSVLQTCLTLAAMLAYVRASRLNLYASPTPAMDAPPPRPTTHPEATGPLAWTWLGLAVLLWVLALLSRESAIVLPLILVSLDWAFGGRRQVRARIGAYLVMAGVAGAFLIWRLSLAYHPMPDFYLRRYDGPAYIGWYAVKLLHWITSAIWLSPMTIGPTARIHPITEVPGDCLLMLAIVTVMSSGYYLACRGARGWWIWPLWVLLTFLPVVPVMAGPQSGYPAGVGFALAMVLGPALREDLRPTGIGRWSKPIAIWFLIATCTYIPIYRKMWHSMMASERVTLAGVAACPPPPTARELFFVNLPFVNIYAGLHAREVLPELDREWRTHVLTYAPHLLRVEHPTQIEQVDAWSFRLRMMGGRPYFSGALGRYLIESMRPSGRLRQGQTIPAELFEARITEADDDGVREVTFRFRRPLASPEYAFYVTTNQSGAMRVRFWGPDAEPPAPAPAPAEKPLTLGQVGRAAEALRAGLADEAASLFTAAVSDDKNIRSAARAALNQVVAPVLAALAAPVQDEFNRPRADDPDWARVRTWWQRHVDNQVLQAFWRSRPEFEAFRYRQQSLFHIREIAARIIRTDLYMTGPPFPSPR